jgi:hypothetical protein
MPLLRTSNSEAFGDVGVVSKTMAEISLIIATIPSGYAGSTIACVSEKRIGLRDPFCQNIDLSIKKCYT